MGGTILASSISGSLDAKNIVMGILTRAQELSNLAGLCQPVMCPELTGNIPVQIDPALAGADLEEWETSQVTTGSFSTIAFELKKDRCKLAVSDEARYKSKAGDPLSLQKQGAALSLARKLDYKVVKAFETSPQTGATAGVWSTVTNNPMADIAAAVAKCRPYKADFIIMPSAVWAKYLGNNYTAQMVQGNAVTEMGKVVDRIPGVNLDVYLSEDITAKSILVGASGCPAAVHASGPVKVRQEDIMEGGEVWQIDVWRQVKAPIIKNDSTLNMGVAQVTGVIA